MSFIITNMHDIGATSNSLEVAEMFMDWYQQYFMRCGHLFPEESSMFHISWSLSTRFWLPQPSILSCVNDGRAEHGAFVARILPDAHLDGVTWSRSSCMHTHGIVVPPHEIGVGGKYSLGDVQDDLVLLTEDWWILGLRYGDLCKMTYMEFALRSNWDSQYKSIVSIAYMVLWFSICLGWHSFAPSW